ncbi:alpha/beta hydrolase [Actinomycetospora endophytica]|uniref:Alpha/beta hydrolase n=1 Tax=Actinomycetospora endophytica TaxID=2291215 RepID=A0ABS8PEZ8_9PSEU|nr:alpha/beta hydrolase [Actinomycetospora endophytica]MCD2196085.1 alpha/beta hydrolase [Actinomycetospora endophytica]
MAVRVLVGLPGTICSPAVFAPTAEALRGTVEVHAVSWMTEPGPWKVPDVADAVARRIETRHGGPVVLVGHSTGGAIAAHLAGRRPDLVAALVLVDTGAHTRRHGDVDSIIARFRDEWGEPIRRAVVDRSFAGELPPEVHAELLRYAAEVPQQAAVEVLESQRDLDLTAGLLAFDGPAAVVHGIHDRARSVAEAEELAALLPTATLHWADCGHTPVHEAPDVVAGAVRDVLARVSPRIG